MSRDHNGTDVPVLEARWRLNPCKLPVQPDSCFECSRHFGSLGGCLLLGGLNARCERWSDVPRAGVLSTLRTYLNQDLDRVLPDAHLFHWHNHESVLLALKLGLPRWGGGRLGRSSWRSCDDRDSGCNGRRSGSDDWGFGRHGSYEGRSDGGDDGANRTSGRNSLV